MSHATPTWIKIRHDLESDPRVHTMAAHIAQTAPGYILTSQAKDLFGSVTNSAAPSVASCEGWVTRNALRDVTILGLLRVWFAANEHTTDGVFRHATLEYLDTLSGLTGFGDAMTLVGYALHDPENRTLTLPNFTEHNAPNKNGERQKTANAERQQRLRDKRKLEAQNAGIAASSLPPPATSPALQVTPPVTLRGEQNNVIPSYSSSLSNSKSTESTPLTPDQGEGLAKSLPHPASSIDQSDPDPVGTLKRRINALRPKSWGKILHWSAEDESALYAALPNLQLLDDHDWSLISWFFTWANSRANTQSRDGVRITSRRHQFVTELPAYLDRARTCWQSEGSPKLSASGGSTMGTPARRPAPTPPPPAPVLPPDQNAAAFGALIADYGIQRTPKPKTPSPTESVATKRERSETLRSSPSEERAASASTHPTAA